MCDRHWLRVDLSRDAKRSRSSARVCASASQWPCWRRPHLSDLLRCQPMPGTRRAIAFGTIAMVLMGIVCAWLNQDKRVRNRVRPSAGGEAAAGLSSASLALRRSRARDVVTEALAKKCAPVTFLERGDKAVGFGARYFRVDRHVHPVVEKHHGDEIRARDLEHLMSCSCRRARALTWSAGACHCADSRSCAAVRVLAPMHFPVVRIVEGKSVLTVVRVDRHHAPAGARHPQHFA